MSERTVALAGNPNAGKSTVFNELTSMHRHTGNWIGKTVDIKGGRFYYKFNDYTVYDLPGTYSLFSASPEEKLAEDFIKNKNADCTVCVIDSTLLERSLVLAYQVLSLTDRAVVGFYQAVTPRTCGFCVIPTESLHPLTRLIYECLMFIGGAPGSAAAGMKVTTLAVILYTATAMCRGETETVMDRRLIPTEIVRESLVILG